ncbi:MAG: carbamoyltransferase HypF [Vicinamibacterales bacterium]
MTERFAGHGEGRQRARLAVRGAVQGVGFRPFVYRLARELGLDGWVNNSSQGVTVEIEGDAELLRSFILRLARDAPPRAVVQSLETSFLDPVGYSGFSIRESDPGGAATALVLPDIATCGDCLREISDPLNRRFRYPFTNCTNCGPRFSIIEELPYDRPNTTMRGFAMCEDCRREYEDPADRRFHAQPNACPLCGPGLRLLAPGGALLSAGDAALREAERAIEGGKVAAIKGLGGFHLVADARSEEAVARLRARKAREEKPFALMYPSIAAVAEDCEVEPLEERLLLSPEAPIVLLRRRDGGGRPVRVAEGVAPGNPYLGVMLPYTPLHHLLLGDLQFPVVATSGNRSDEPICTDEAEALERLAGLADLFLVHDRPIARHVDDSIVRIVVGRELVLRRARGYAPLPVPLRPAPPQVASVGAHLKNTVAVSAGDNVFLSQHVGDLETREAYGAFREVLDSLRRLYRVEPAAVGCDLHPGYISTAFAHGLGLPVVEVQHHYAHVLSCMAENELEGEVLGVSWDGTGLGPDGTIWGGEFLIVDETGFERAGHLRCFPLPGGDQAVREPRRAALGVLYEMEGGRLDVASKVFDRGFLQPELRILERMLATGTNVIRTSSAGRLFDAAAFLAFGRPRVRYEGQAAMELEFAAERAAHDATADSYQSYPARVTREGPVAGGAAPVVVDWEPMFRAILEDVRAGVDTQIVAARFHNCLIESIVEVARLVGRERVVLTGGCFQNRYLLERSVARLSEDGFRPAWHQRVPPNDGGVALGQVVAAVRWLRAHGLERS